MEKQHTPVFFGEWVKCRRKSLDLTHSELAKRVGCSISAIRKIESGDRKPSKQLSGLLAKALEIPEENSQTFIRISRGDLNLERLSQSDLELFTHIPETSSFRKPLAVVVPKESKQPPTSHVPSQPTPMIGRDIEYSALERLFNDPQCRLLTLTGVGGIGKTRLALEFAARKQAAFPGGVFYFPLSAITSPCKIIFSIAEGLACAFSGPAEPKEQLFHFISCAFQNRALFIFDNLEHLLSQCVEENEKFGLVDLVSEILQRLPQISILGTSRERLNVHGEWAYELHGLSVPPTNYVGMLEEYDSVALFLNSARRIKPEFQLSIEDHPSVVQICQLVDGVPLAIELAAAWVGILSCQEIAQEIQSNMDFLTTSMRDIPERHRSIRATFNHSWKFLSDEERKALCQLSIFRGGFDRYAAQAVASASLATLASLSDKSLIRCIARGRYDLHQVIRQYALAHLDDYPACLGAYERHCQYYLGVTQECEQSLKTAAQQDAVRQMTAEIDNIRAAWSWAIGQKRYALLGQAGRAYGWYFEITGMLQEGTEQLELLIQAIREEPEADPWNRVLSLGLIHQGLLYLRRGEFFPAEARYEEAIRLLRPIGDKALLCDAMIFLGIIMHHSGRYEQARALFQEGLGFARDVRNRCIEAYAIFGFGYIDSLMGQHSEGYTQMMAALAIWREIGDPFTISLGLNFLVYTLIKLNRHEEAKASMLESIALCEQVKNRWGMGNAFCNLGLATMAAGEFAQAQDCFHKSLEIFRDYTIGWDIARATAYLAKATRSSGDDAEAKRYYLDALRISMEAQILPIALDVIMGLIELEQPAFPAETAFVVSNFVLNHPSSEEETRTRAAQQCADSETLLTALQVASAKTLAASKTLDEIVSLAVNAIEV